MQFHFPIPHQASSCLIGAKDSSLIFFLALSQAIVLSTSISIIAGGGYFGVPIWSKNIERTSFTEDMSGTKSCEAYIDWLVGRGLRLSLLRDCYLLGGHAMSYSRLGWLVALRLQEWAN